MRLFDVQLVRWTDQFESPPASASASASYSASASASASSSAPTSASATAVAPTLDCIHCHLDHWILCHLCCHICCYLCQLCFFLLPSCVLMVNNIPPCLQPCQLLGTFKGKKKHPSLGGNPYYPDIHKEVMTRFRLGLLLVTQELEVLHNNCVYPRQGPRVHDQPARDGVDGGGGHHVS